MAVIKHGSSKNANYGAAELYLEYEHDEDTQRPILDEYGHYIPRQEYIISGIHCTPDTYAMECIKANLKYGQNQNKGDVKSHHYIISFDPRDRDDHNLTLEEVHQMGSNFAVRISLVIRLLSVPTPMDTTKPAIFMFILLSTPFALKT